MSQINTNQADFGNFKLVETSKGKTSNLNLFSNIIYGPDGNSEETEI